MLYRNKSFTVPASGKRDDPCECAWIDSRGNCVLCGKRTPTPLVGKLNTTANGTLA